TEPSSVHGGVLKYARSGLSEVFRRVYLSLHFHSCIFYLFIFSIYLVVTFSILSILILSRFPFLLLLYILYSTHRTPSVVTTTYPTEGEFFLHHLLSVIYLLLYGIYLQQVCTNNTVVTTTYPTEAFIYNRMSRNISCVPVLPLSCHLPSYLATTPTCPTTPTLPYPTLPHPTLPYPT